MKRRWFKNKEKRRQFLILFFAILVGIVFILEIVAFPLMYREPESDIKTPEEMIKKFSNQWIFGENLTAQEKEFLIPKGITIVSYYYINNPGFFELESLVNSLEGQVILEKINSNETKVELNSLRDMIVLENLSQESIFEGLCKTLYYPPADCASFEE